MATCPALIAGGRKIPAWVKQQLKGDEPDKDTDGDDDIPNAGESNIRVGTKRKARSQDTGAEEPEEEDEGQQEGAGVCGGTGAAEQQQRR